ncbi:hypothetical protein K435DRAFT_22226 [Dendrothele bispora CBS 962.96]|uniref:Topoisomerase I damage affected protein 2 n=1 Tax=Dendrothele bispora (strain CBS 962.96) TaxID=1314807 RepID=A0A4S8N1K4_DENBC|nr:hypothetical protein K435DRAFT_22226 [Dendrothele bispora CBS 962.96]
MALTSTSTSTSILSPPRTPPRSGVSSPRPSIATTPPTATPPTINAVKFDSELLKVYIKQLLSSTLQSASWPESKDRDRVKAWMKEIGERVKERMVGIQPKGFKYIVLTQINENLGQGGRADMVCHWEDSDTVAQEVFVNDSLICICIAFAVRTY